MPRKAPMRSIRSRSRKMSVSPTTEAFVSPPLEDKQELIRTYAERRTAHPRGNLFGMYIGVAICTIFVLVGWAIAFPKSLGSSSGQPDEAMEAVQRYGSAFTQSFAKDKPFQETARFIEKMKQQVHSAQN